MSDWQTVKEQEYGRAFVHESGHALMAVLQSIPCHGIYYEKASGRFCAIADLPPDSELSNKHYLFLAASSAAELIIYGDEDGDGANSDRKPFANPGAPPFEVTAKEAYAIVLGKKRQLKRLISTLKSKCRQVEYDLAALPEKHMDGTNLAYAVLISREELESAVQNS